MEAEGRRFRVGTYQGKWFDPDTLMYRNAADKL